MYKIKYCLLDKMDQTLYTKSIHVGETLGSPPNFPNERCVDSFLSQISPPVEVPMPHLLLRVRVLSRESSNVSTYSSFQLLTILSQ